MVCEWMRWMVVMVIVAGCTAVSDELDDDRDSSATGDSDDAGEVPSAPPPEPDPEPEPVPPRTPAPDDDACRDLDEPCAFESDCCVHPDGALVCVANEDGSGSCRAGCETDDDCDSGCCVALHGGTSACVDAAECAHGCAPLGDICEVDAECCVGTTCVDGQCAAHCDTDTSCPTGCCGAADTCTSAEHCGGQTDCIDGTHFCSDGRDLFECDGARWFGIDCDAACIDAGWGGSVGCQWSVLWEDDACLCAAA